MVRQVTEVSKVSDGEITIFPNYGFFSEIWPGGSKQWLELFWKRNKSPISSLIKLETKIAPKCDRCSLEYCVFENGHKSGNNQKFQTPPSHIVLYVYKNNIYQGVSQIKYNVLLCLYIFYQLVSDILYSLSIEETKWNYHIYIYIYIIFRVRITNKQ